MRNPYDKVCGRCGANIRDREVHGRDAQTCICLIQYDGERMPDCWHYARDIRSVPIVD